MIRVPGAGVSEMPLSVTGPRDTCAVPHGLGHEARARIARDHPDHAEAASVPSGQATAVCGGRAGADRPRSR